MQAYEPHFQRLLAKCGSWLPYWTVQIQNTSYITECSIEQHWYWGELGGYCSSLSRNNKAPKTDSGHGNGVEHFSSLEDCFCLASH